jgi:hypothetical protein
MDKQIVHNAPPDGERKLRLVAGKDFNAIAKEPQPWRHAKEGVPAAAGIRGKDAIKETNHRP